MARFECPMQVQTSLGIPKLRHPYPMLLQKHRKALKMKQKLESDIDFESGIP